MGSPDIKLQIQKIDQPIGHRSIEALGNKVIGGPNMSANMNDHIT